MLAGNFRALVAEYILSELLDACRSEKGGEKGGDHVALCCRLQG